MIYFGNTGSVAEMIQKLHHRTKLNDRGEYTTKGMTWQTNSGLQRISRGVPQGSVLGPILFILYTNNFRQYVTNFSSRLVHADDTLLLLWKAAQEEREINVYTAVNMVIQSCHGNDLVNEKKTQQQIIGRHENTTGKLPELEE